MDLFSLEGRTALVTGGSRGLGKIVAAAFVARGAKVYISSRKTEPCDATAAELSRGGGVCVSLPRDLSTVEGCQALASRLGELEPSLDILVNNAGAAWGAAFDAFPESGWDKVMDLNLKSPFFLTQALHGMLAAAASPARPAKVINIASMDGMRLNPLEAYSYQAKRLARDRIVVSGIAPGHFASDMNRDARDRAEATAQTIPIRRIGNDDDIAGAAIYLASRAGDYVVGETIVVDGGVTLAA
jgi:2-deoxy-D-gluconate 3-dehydrogenase